MDGTMVPSYVAWDHCPERIKRQLFIERCLDAQSSNVGDYREVNSHAYAKSFGQSSRLYKVAGFAVHCPLFHVRVSGVASSGSMFYSRE
jgi:hypothetical protein